MIIQDDSRDRQRRLEGLIRQVERDARLEQEYADADKYPSREGWAEKEAGVEAGKTRGKGAPNQKKRVSVTERQTVASRGWAGQTLAVNSALTPSH